MSTALVREQILTFLATPGPSVLCIRGNWGTGKTYTWQAALQIAAAKSETLTTEKYAYVSLFGLNSVDQVKQEIVTQTIGRDRIGKPFSPDDVGSIYNEGVSLFRKNAAPFAKLWESYYAAAMSVATALIRDRLVCIDDLERKGEQLRSADILGLISQLKEDRKCKVVLLLNDEQLDDRTEFESYLEKVVDINVRFAPTPVESAEIALQGVEGDDSLKQKVRDLSPKLGIDNVRVIRKLFRFLQQLAPLLKGYEPGVLDSVAATVVLMGWAHLQPELAPSKEFLVKQKGSFSDYVAKKNGEIPLREQEWTTLINNYGYMFTDEFDVALLRCIENGFFTKATVDSHALELNQRVETDIASVKLRDTWRAFHDSFDGELDDHLKKFTDCIAANAKYYSLNDMLSVVNLFRSLDRKDAGNSLLDLYLDARKGTINAYDLHDVELFGIHLDDDVRAKLIALQTAQRVVLAVEELFLMLADNGYDRNITEQLAALPVGEYVRVFKHHKGSNFRIMRRGLTQYNNLANPNEFHIEIMRKANEALQQIAHESPLNSFRVSRWGIAERLANIPAPALQRPSGEREQDAVDEPHDECEDRR
jgi:hypothetical protein